MTPDAPLPPVEIPAGPYRGEPTRRVRFDPSTDPRLRQWLRQVARCHAHLCGVVRCYAAPQKAGGASLFGDDFARRIAAGDPSLLYDALGYCGGEIDDLREQIGRFMDSAPPTPHLPGSLGKIAEMMRRLERGYSLFVPADARVSLD